MMIAHSSVMYVGGGAIVAALLLMIAFAGNGTDAQVERRIGRIAGYKPLATGKGGVPSARRITADSGFAWFDSLIKTLMPNPDKLRSRIAKTGRNITLGEYLLMNGILIIVAFLALAFGFHWSKGSAAFLGIAVGLYIPHTVINIMGKKRIRKFLANFPEAIDTMSRGLRSGLPVTESIAAVGREMPDPVGIEFKRISDGVRVGRTLEDAMWDVTRRIDVSEFRFLIIAMAIQKETGGNLAETLGNLADLIRRRRQLRLKIRAMSSEARASAMIIGSLPFVMFTLLWVVNSDYVMTLFRSLQGNILLGFGLGMISAGIFVMNKMISFEI